MRRIARRRGAAGHDGHARRHGAVRRGAGRQFHWPRPRRHAVAANDSINASSAYVTFEPGARSAWHTHPQGQYLVVTAGAGLTQEWGKPVQQLRPGDVAWCPPGVKHWHGAALATAMTHLAITGTLNGKSVEWLEKVSDEQYQAQ